MHDRDTMMCVRLHWPCDNSQKEDHLLLDLSLMASETTDGARTTTEEHNTGVMANDVKDAADIKQRTQ